MTISFSGERALMLVAFLVPMLFGLFLVTSGFHTRNADATFLGGLFCGISNGPFAAFWLWNGFQRKLK